MMAAMLAAIRAVLTRLRSAGGRPRPASGARLPVIAITHSPHTKLALRVCMFQEEWQCLIATSLEHALSLLQRHPVCALIYDVDSGEADWRELCSFAVERGISFQLIVPEASDDLFLAVMSAGGSGLLWKPVTSPQLVSAIQFAHALAESQLSRAAQREMV